MSDLDMTAMERFERTMKGERLEHVFVSCALQTGTVELMEASGAHWPEALADPELMAKLALAAHEIVGFESVRVPFCVTSEARELGCTIKEATPDQQPSVTKGCVESMEDIDNLEIPDPNTAGRMAVNVEAVKILREEVGKDVPIIAGATGPFTLAVHMRGESFFMDMFAGSELVPATLDFAGKVSVEMAKAYVKAGADWITIIDPTSTYELIGPDSYKKLSMPYEKAIVDAVHDLGKYTVLHICGYATPMTPLMAETGSDAISVDQKVSIVEAKELIPPETILVGNVDPAHLLWRGTPEAVKEASIKCIDDGVDVLCPGCGIAPRTPTVNLQAIVEAARTHPRPPKP